MKKTIFLQDYTPPAYLVDTVNLRVELDEQQTRVSAQLTCRPNDKVKPGQPLVLNGEYCVLQAVSLDDAPLGKEDYAYADSLLTIPVIPDRPFQVGIETIINPRDNSALEGLYLSSGNYCTQCEAEGFRRITCYPDRPDVMAVFTTTIIADRKKCPVLLSNGNLIEEGKLSDGRHFATWYDPFKKPSYLFALVAGQLVSIEDTYTTLSGRQVDLRIYVEQRNQEKCDHAMASLKKAMRWDEKVFGREYDLDTYMIVAVDDFNMGAMENKGLNVFNSKFVLARPETATDVDYEGIEGVIAHEYFHNWTGNRITCRDWFQLSLKEGLTVFRDQEFSADMTSRPVKRIHDVNVMRSFQFREDAGPLAHPVRPASFVEINNFYTLTVYNKGAEVIRMLHTLLGADGFRRGMDLYFERHDGQAVTCDDFISAMEQANAIDLFQFKRWYSQAGTPELSVEQQYDADRQEFYLTVSQSCPSTPGQEDKKPLLMPLRIGLLASDGSSMNGQNKNAGTQKMPEDILVLDEQKQVFTWAGVSEKPVVSLLRNFSAPVKIHSFQNTEELAFLMANDSDPFNRWNAGQQLALSCLLDQITRYQQGEAVTVSDLFVQAFARVLCDDTSDPAFLAQALALPTENWIGQQMACVDPDAVFAVRQDFRYQLSGQLRESFLKKYQETGSKKTYQYSSIEAGRRSFRNCCLGYLLSPAPGHEVLRELLVLGRQQYAEADNMTDCFAALHAVVNADRAAGDALLADFYEKWHDDPLVVDKWLTLQATCTLPGSMERVQALTAHTAFTLKNPNKVRALIGAFSGSNYQFHRIDGKGYCFLVDQILELDAMNPQIAARLVTPLTQWKRYDTKRQDLMREQFLRIEKHPGLSSDVAEIVAKSLHA